MKSTSSKSVYLEDGEEHADGQNSHGAQCSDRHEPATDSTRVESRTNASGGGESATAACIAAATTTRVHTRFAARPVKNKASTQSSQSSCGEHGEHNPARSILIVRRDENGAHDGHVIVESATRRSANQPDFLKINQQVSQNQIQID
jgi:hypothetical protein